MDDKILLKYLSHIVQPKDYANCIDKIESILKFNIPRFINKLIMFRDIYIKDIDIIKYCSDDHIKDRVKNYFNKQKSEIKQGAIKACINFQYIISSRYANNILSILLKTNEKKFNVVNSQPINSYNIEKNNDIDIIITDILTTYLNKIKLNSNSPIKKKGLSITARKIIDIIDNILPILISHSSNGIVCFGSYTAYNLDSSISYGDIDMYSPKAYNILIILMCLMYFVTGYELYMFSIPFIPGHISLKYGNDEIIDCIYVPYNTLSTIPKSRINDVLFVDPGLQMLNNIRMGTEIFRSHNIYKNFTSTLNKYKSLLNYFIQNSEFDVHQFKRILHDDIKIDYKIDNNKLIINLDSIVENSLFNNIVVLFDSPKICMEYMGKLDGNFSRKYYAILNEIFFESELVGGSTNTIKEENIIKLNRNDLVHTDTILNLNGKTLYFTNLTMTTFVKNTDGKINDISDRNIISFIATAALYSFFHGYDSFGLSLYYIILNNITKINDDLNKWNEITRYKIKGEHVYISMTKNVFHSIIPYKETDFEYANYDTFIKYTSINGGF